MEKSVKLRTIMKNLLLFISVIVSTSASALVVSNPNAIYMIGASVNAQLYNKKELVGSGVFLPNTNVIDKDNPLYFSDSVDDKDKIFWGQIPNNYDLYFIPAVDSNISSMIYEYYNTVNNPFAPVLPAPPLVLVGWVASMCEPPGDEEGEGLEGIKAQTYDLILNAHSSTKFVLMKYPTEGIDFSDQGYCVVNDVRGDYITNAENYNRYIETLRSWFASVSVIDPWDSYSPATDLGDPVHADDATLESAASRIRECFENGLPPSCLNTP
jgi:hypothetical protein